MRLFKNFQMVDYATIIFAVFIFVPFIKAAEIPSPWFIGLALWVFAFLGNRKARAYFLRSKFLRYIVFLWIIVLGITALVGQTTVVNRYASMLCIPFSYIVYDFNRFQNKKDVNLKLFFIIALIAFVPVIPTIVALHFFPSAVRIIKTEGENTLMMAARGVGDYSTIYSSIILTLLFTVIFLEAKVFRWKRIYVYIIAVFELAFLVMIVMSNYFTALALTVFGQLSLILLVKYRKSVYYIIPLLIVYSIFSKPINLFVIDSSLAFFDTGGKNYNRLALIKDNINRGVDAGDDLNSREGTNKKSFEIISTYPLQGAVLSSDFKMSKMGQHSTVLDTWGFYGLMLGSLLIVAFVLPLRNIYKFQKNYHSRISVLIVSGIYLLLISVNNLTPQISFMAFFMMPSLFDRINCQMNKQIVVTQSGFGNRAEC